MAFRDRLLLGLVALALSAAGLQAGLGWLRFRGALERDRASDLSSYATLVRGVLDTSGEVPDLVPERLPLLAGTDGRFRVLQGATVVLEGGGRFPEGAAAWRTLAVPLEDGATLEVALDQGEIVEAMREYLRTSGVALVASLVFAVLLALALRWHLLRPLERLRRSSDALAHQRFPEPLEVRGNDELGRLARTFNSMVEQVRRALERERAFTRYASHELRTPVASLKTTAEAVRSGALDGEALLPVAERTVERLERTLAGLLALARAPGERERVDAVLLLGDVLEAIPAAERGRVQLRAEPATVQVPRAALEGAIRNLVDNALRHSEGRVWLSFDVDGGNARVRVRDEGPGVPEPMLARLGEPFRRGRRSPGTGLGLAYTRQVAEELGGRLELGKAASGGFEACLTLPHGG